MSTLSPPTPSSIPPTPLLTTLISLTKQDPHLPPPNPTTAFWQSPPCPLSTHQSPTLPSKVTYAIIGSGITACSVATNLLEQLSLPSSSTQTGKEEGEHQSSPTVAVFEARTLCSGATGRNGGHLLSPMPEEFVAVKDFFGTEEAVKIGRFARRTLGKMFELGEMKGEEGAEVRRVEAVTGYWDEERFEVARKGVEMFEREVGESKGEFRVLGGGEAEEEFNLNSPLGAIVSQGGAFWPYRLITSLFSHLLTTYPTRFSLETHTPITAINPSSSSDRPTHPYLLTTPRGPILATHIIHCTNGWTGHLLPGMRGKIFPIRGTMSTQAAGSTLPREGGKKSWSTMSKPTYDPKDGTFTYGMYYITQNERTGDVFVGGEKQRPENLVCADDSGVEETSREKLEGILPEIFKEGWKEGEKPEIKSLWSGILGFTPDQVPWVGRVPGWISGREVRGGEGKDAVGGEWIAAGFNGYGMPLCWGCGEAVAGMLLGKEEEVREWLPRSFEMTRARLRSLYSLPEAGVVGMLGLEMGWGMMGWVGWKVAVAWVRGLMGW